MEKEIRNQHPTLQVIIVTWNKKKEVMRLLDQLFTDALIPKEMEVIVVDNHSADNTADAVEKGYPEVILLKNDSNLGGAGGFNTGMRWVLAKRAESRYMWLLDNDAQVNENTLPVLMAALIDNPHAAVCGSRIMSSDNPEELIEIGGLINYDTGNIERHLPEEKELKSQPANAVFEVDYVAACSLLVRTDVVRQVGLWRERFFIYWDDMEWGARINAAGFKVLAANDSVVYHPSWAGRIRNSSVVWREYYRTRNSLFFFNIYLEGIQRRKVLVRMVLRFMKFSASTGLKAEAALSRSFIEGVNDFFNGRYGRKNLLLPPNELDKCLAETVPTRLLIYLQKEDAVDVERALDFATQLNERYASVKIAAVVPARWQPRWQKLCGPTKVHGVDDTKNGLQAVFEGFRVLMFLACCSWQILITEGRCPRKVAVWGKPVARMDFLSGSCIAVEKTDFKSLLRLPIMAGSFLLRAIWKPPPPAKPGIERTN